MEKYLTEFYNYINSLEKDSVLLDLFRHSLRVSQYAKEIGEKENLSKDNINIVFACALFSKIGLFEYYNKYHKMDMLDPEVSVLGVNKIKEFPLDELMYYLVPVINNNTDLELNKDQLEIINIVATATDKDIDLNKEKRL